MPLWNLLLLKAWGSLFRQGIAKGANGEYGTLLFAILDFYKQLIVKEQMFIAKPAAFSRELQVGDSHDQRILEHIYRRFGAVVLHLAPPFAAQVVKAQAIGFGVISFQQFFF